MTQAELEAFLAVVRCGTVSGAAQQLFITQPALSRRLGVLEEELGYPPLQRGRGRRSVELTAQGRAFVSVAEKWLTIWQEAKDLKKLNGTVTLRLESIVSVSTYLLGPVLRRFLQLRPDARVRYHTCTSRIGYDDVGLGLVDLAIISDRMYHPRVKSLPVFREPMVLVMNGPAPAGAMLPSALDPVREVRMPWYPECDQWHDYWFGPDVQATVLLDQMAWMEDLLLDKGAWAVVPASVARRLPQGQGIQRCKLEQGPPDRIIYALLGQTQKPLMDEFLEAMRQGLAGQPEMESYL